MVSSENMVDAYGVVVVDGYENCSDVGVEEENNDGAEWNCD